LACFGVERGGGGEGGYHIGVFRAMSVLRTARLLAISSGTTVSCFFFLFGGCVDVWGFFFAGETDYYALA
jgi:hypothetical protein